MAGDALVREASGGADFDGLWSRSTPFGQDGYFNDVSFDGPDVSHHVLTADGILGRDTLGIGAFDAPSIPPRRSAVRRSLDAVSGLVAPRRVPPTASPMGAESPVDPLPPRE